MQQPSKNTVRSTPSNQTTKTNTRPNPNGVVRKPTPTYRARPATATPPGGHDIMSQRTAIRLQTDARRRRIRLAIFLAVGFFVAGGIAAYAYIYQPVQKTIEQINTTIKDVFVTPVTVRPAPGSGPNATPVTVTYPNWSKNEPVNILLLGLDFRPEEQDSRADTMIVVHIDPAEKTATMLSIPRDLWVPIPGHGEARINAAFQLGEDDKTTPGGGPGLAMATVEDNFNIPIHYFAQVDFTGFERIVDAMGGINIDVPRPLADNEYPYGDYGYSRIYVPAGLQHLDGHTALQICPLAPRG